MLAIQDGGHLELCAQVKNKQKQDFYNPVLDILKALFLFVIYTL